MLLLAAALRVIGLGWGLPDADHPPFHPDEPQTFQYGSELYSRPAAMTFAWGGVLYLRLSLAAQILAGGDYAATLLLLRALNVAFALVSVGLVAWIGARLFGPAAGLVAAALLACFPNHVLTSHFARPDVLMTLLATGALACACRFALGGGRAFLVAGALLAGLAAATMLAGAVAFAALAAALLERAWDRERVGAAALATGLALTGLAGLAGYLLGSFESLLQPEAFGGGMRIAWNKHNQGGFALPLQLLGGSALYAFGSVGALAAYAGLAFLVLRRRPGSLTLAAYLLAGFAMLARLGGEMTVHLLFLTPAAALAAAVALRSAPWLAVAAIALTLQLSLGYVLPLQLGEDARSRAGRWLVENAPAGATLGVTRSFHGDHTYQPRLPAGHDLRVVSLMTRRNFDAVRYLEQPPDYVATTDYAAAHAAGPTAPDFYRELFDGTTFRQVASFGPDFGPLCLPERLGLRRPGDLSYLRSTFYVFERKRSESARVSSTTR